MLSQTECARRNLAEATTLALSRDLADHRLGAERGRLSGRSPWPAVRGASRRLECEGFSLGVYGYVGAVGDFAG